MSRAQNTSHVYAGVARATNILIFFAIAALFLGGVTYSFFPTEHSKILGLIFLIFSVTVMAASINQWAKALVPILALAALNALFMFATGHLLNSPSVRVSRADVLVILLYCVVGCLLLTSIIKRELAVHDRAAVMLFAFTLALLLGHGSTTINGAMTGSLTFADFVFMSSGMLGLLVAMLYGRLRTKSIPTKKQVSRV